MMTDTASTSTPPSPTRGEPYALRFRTTREVDRPAAEVWRVLADYGRDPEWRQGVETMAPSTTGVSVVGTTTDEVLHLLGQTYRNHGEVVDVEPGRRLEWRTTEGADADGARTVDPVGDGRCRVTLELCVRPKGVERMLAPVLRRVMARGQRADLDRLAALVEGATATHR